ncbi:MAG: 4'-phosphopantetheinyl transferase superfamily protein [Pirellulales bacterium]
MYIPCPASGFHFSLSHTQDLAVIAWSRSTLVGIDVELYRDVAWNELARSALTAAEFKHGQSIPPKNQSRYFLECWTAKEALLKGLGIGIAAGTNTVDLDLKSPQADARIHSFGASLSPWIVEKTKLQFPKILDPKAWRLASIPVGARHIGAIAVHASSITLHQRSLDEL